MSKFLSEEEIKPIKEKFGKAWEPLPNIPCELGDLIGDIVAEINLKDRSIFVIKRHEDDFAFVDGTTQVKLMKYDIKV